MDNESLMECIGILQEECAETSVVISKIRRFGIDDVYNGQTNRGRLVSELGDLLCMIDMLKEHNIVTDAELTNASKLKREKLKLFSNIPNL